MELRNLKYLLAVADRLSFTRAARDLNVSQPALSQQIRQLEEELGIQLFSRNPHRVTITQGGVIVVEHARRTIESANRLREAVNAFQGLERGKLRLAVTQSFNALHLIPALASFLQEHPFVDVTALEWTNSAIIAGVADGTLDLGVAFGPIEAPISARLLYEDRLMLACSNDHRFAALPKVPLHALGVEAVALLTSDYGTRRMLDRFFDEHNVVPSRIIELDTFASILKLVETSLCVSVIPGHPSGALVDSDVIFCRLYPAPNARSIYLLLPPTAAQAPAAIAFGEILLNRFRTN